MFGKQKKSTIIRHLSTGAAALVVFSLLGCGGMEADRLEVSSQPASEQDCPDGGNELIFGYDTNADGTIDEVSHVEVVCRGMEGRPLLVETQSATLEECENGGVTYTFGYDTNGDGEIDDPHGEENVCNGVDGNDGLPMLLETMDVGSEVCENGEGTTYTFGYDTNGDGQIDDVVSAETICIEVSSETIISGARVLYFVDAISGTSLDDVLLDGLEALAGSGFIDLTISPSGAEFRDELEEGEYDVVFSFAQANSLPESTRDTLLDWVNNDNRLIFATFSDDDNDELFAALESNASGSTNHDDISFTSPRAGFQLPVEMALFTDPWTVHSLGLEPSGAGVSICEFDDGDSCAILGNDGRTLHLGVMSDVFPAAHGEQIAANLLATVLEGGF